MKECEICDEGIPNTTRKIIIDGDEEIFSICYSCDNMTDKEIYEALGEESNEKTSTLET